MIFLYIAVLITGFICLVKGADIFVDGSCGVARIFHVSGLVIGLTIVALGTSAPELAVSTSAALQNSNEIALSNVVGSNLFNLLMVLGLCSMIRDLPVDGPVRRRDFPISIAASVIVFITVAKDYLPFRFLSAGMTEIAGTVIRPVSIFLLVAFIIYIAYLVIETRNNPDNSESGRSIPMWKCLIMIAAGIALIVAGGRAVVYSARNLALAMGLTETLIGLTVVAIGTSLPELVTSMVAARKGETGLAVGNAVGSNIFNMMLILGVSSSIHPITVNMASVCDLFILILISIMTWIFSFTGGSIKRPEGAVMVLCYTGVMIFAILR